MVQGSELAEEEDESKEVEEEVEEGGELAGMCGQFRVHCFGFTVSDFNFRVLRPDSGYRVLGSGSWFSGSGFRVSNFGGQISGPGCTSHTMRSSSRSWGSASENAYERRGDNLKRIKDFCLKAKARI